MIEKYYMNKQSGLTFCKGPDGFSRYWNNYTCKWTMSFFTNKDLEGEEFSLLTHWERTFG